VSDVTTTDTTMTEPRGDRLGELRDAVRRLRVGAARGDHEHTLMVLGGVLAPLGIIAVLLGWFGASHTPNAFEQVPYLISGGLLGLGFVFLGGFLYFSHWVTVLVREGRAQSDRAVEALERIESTLTRLSAPAVPAAAAAPAAAPAVSVPVDEPLYATVSGSMLHRRECPVVASRDNLRVVAAGTPGFKTCRICHA
jgi:hypothetical protein